MILRIFKSIRLFSYKIAFPSQLNNNGQYNFTDKHTRVQSSENKKSFSNAELSGVEEKEVQKIVDIDKIIRQIANNDKIKLYQQILLQNSNALSWAQMGRLLSFLSTRRFPFQNEKQLFTMICQKMSNNLKQIQLITICQLFVSLSSMNCAVWTSQFNQFKNKVASHILEKVYGKKLTHMQIQTLMNYNSYVNTLRFPIFESLLTTIDEKGFTIHSSQIASLICTAPLQLKIALTQPLSRKLVMWLQQNISNQNLITQALKRNLLKKQISRLLVQRILSEPTLRASYHNNFQYLYEAIRIVDKSKFYDTFCELTSKLRGASIWGKNEMLCVVICWRISHHLPIQNVWEWRKQVQEQILQDVKKSSQKNHPLLLAPSCHRRQFSECFKKELFKYPIESIIKEKEKVSDEFLQLLIQSNNISYLNHLQKKNFGSISADQTIILLKLANKNPELLRGSFRKLNILLQLRFDQIHHNSIKNQGLDEYMQFKKFKFHLLAYLCSIEVYFVHDHIQIISFLTLASNLVSSFTNARHMPTKFQTYFINFAISKPCLAPDNYVKLLQQFQSKFIEFYDKDKHYLSFYLAKQLIKLNKLSQPYATKILQLQFKTQQIVRLKPYIQIAAGIEPNYTGHQIKDQLDMLCVVKNRKIHSAFLEKIIPQMIECVKTLSQQGLENVIINFQLPISSDALRLLEAITAAYQAKMQQSMSRKALFALPKLQQLRQKSMISQQGFTKIESKLMKWKILKKVQQNGQKGRIGDEQVG